MWLCYWTVVKIQNTLNKQLHPVCGPCQHCILNTALTKNTSKKSILLYFYFTEKNNLQLQNTWSNKSPSILKLVKLNLELVLFYPRQYRYVFIYLWPVCEIAVCVQILQSCSAFSQQLLYKCWMTWIHLQIHTSETKPERTWGGAKNQCDNGNISSVGSQLGSPGSTCVHTETSDTEETGEKKQHF